MRTFVDKLFESDPLFFMHTLNERMVLSYIMQAFAHLHLDPLAKHKHSSPVTMHLVPIIQGVTTHLKGIIDMPIISMSVDKSKQQKNFFLQLTCQSLIKLHKIFSTQGVKDKKSYISQELKNSLSLSTIWWETFEISLFWSERGRAQTHKVTQFCLRSPFIDISLYVNANSKCPPNKPRCYIQ